jgi:glc operon protein GlcG
MGVPQCIAVVDDGGNLLAFVRIDGSRFLSVDSSIRKAKGGLPIVLDREVIGAISVGSGTGDQDVEVATAGIAAIAGAVGTLG